MEAGNIFGNERKSVLKLDNIYSPILCYLSTPSLYEVSKLYALVCETGNVINVSKIYFCILLDTWIIVAWIPTVYRVSR